MPVEPIILVVAVACEWRGGGIEAVQPSLGAGPERTLVQPLNRSVSQLVFGKPVIEYHDIRIRIQILRCVINAAKADSFISNSHI